jgi:hypothetical protein
MIDQAHIQAANHIAEQFMWSWTTLTCLTLGWVSHMLMDIYKWQQVVGTKVSIREYFSASWVVTIMSLFLAIGLYIALPELGKYMGFDNLGMTPLSALLVGYTSDSIADMAGKRVNAALNLPPRG